VPGVHTLPIPAEPVCIPLRQGLLQPVRGGCGQRFQRGTQRLGDELHPVQLAHISDHPGGIRALPPSLAQQSSGQGSLQDCLQHALFQAVRDQPGPEPGQQ